MVVLAAVLVTLLCTTVLSKDIPAAEKVSSDLDLKLVHVIFRHGARTPADTYPTDPYINNTFAPFGWGQLTNAGRVQLFENGKFLRKRYDEFLGHSFTLDDVYAQATGVTRTKMSLQLALAGLFPPKGTPLEWSKDLNWVPIPYNYEELDQDTLLLVRTTCPRYHEELERVLAEDAAEEIKKNEQLFKDLTRITGMDIKTPDDIQSLYSTLKAEREYGLTLPDWTKEYFPEKLQSLTDLSYVYGAYNPELKRFKGGVFVRKTIDDWEKKIADKLKTKIMLFAGHDSTVTNIFSAFNVWQPQFPDYGITGLLEFSKHKVTGEYGVQIFLRNSTAVEPHLLTIPGCAEFCTLKEMKTLLKDNIPADRDQACKPKTEGFTEPPLSGP